MLTKKFKYDGGSTLFGSILTKQDNVHYFIKNTKILCMRILKTIVGNEIKSNKNLKI